MRVKKGSLARGITLSEQLMSFLPLTALATLYRASASLFEFIHRAPAVPSDQGDRRSYVARSSLPRANDCHLCDLYTTRRGRRISTFSPPDLDCPPRVLSAERLSDIRISLRGRVFFSPPPELPHVFEFVYSSVLPSSLRVSDTISVSPE